MAQRFLSAVLQPVTFSVYTSHSNLVQQSGIADFHVIWLGHLSLFFSFFLFQPDISIDPACKPAGTRLNPPFSHHDHDQTEQADVRLTSDGDLSILMVAVTQQQNNLGHAMRDGGVTQGHASKFLCFDGVKLRCQRKVGYETQRLYRVYAKPSSTLAVCFEVILQAQAPACIGSNRYCPTTAGLPATLFKLML
jgi:hypothetical protein